MFNVRCLQKILTRDTIEKQFAKKSPIFVKFILDGIENVTHDHIHSIHSYIFHDSTMKNDKMKRIINSSKSA